MAAAIVILPAPPVSDLPPPMTLVVNGSVRTAPPGATLQEAARMLGLNPAAGDLVDVEGVPLRRDFYPGHVVVNGQPAAAGTALHDGDAVELVAGVDRVEPVTVDTLRVRAGTIPNPQAYLGTVGGEQIITKGTLSGKLVSATFRPVGEATVRPAVALTFDDGPSPRYTLRILRTLRQRNVPATFFVVGYLARRYPDVVRRLVESGMSLGNHSMHHPGTRPFADLPLHEIREQIERGHGVVTELGERSAGFRPPGGSWSGAVRDVAAAEGERIILWSVDAEDFAGLPPRVVARRVVREAEPGSIVLLHDGGGNRTATVKALPRIITGLRKKGLAFESL
ncbi:MAG TPA: polysaccharide deacetylase family protein [Actinomycetota bacterium]|nr:polysaccharide deacetylase family protein [Actinomycetota bacterium]